MLYLASNPILNAYAGSDIFGKAIFLALLALSVVTWTLFYKKFSWQRAIIEKGEHFALLFNKKRQTPLAIEVKEGLHPYAALYKTLKENTLELLQKNQKVLEGENGATLSRSDIDFIEGQMETEASIATKNLENNLFILATIASLAPFLGLLGTVWGILLTFAELQGGGVANTNATVMGGLSMALGTTVVGLIVAIPALIAYNYLKASTTRLATSMEDFSHTLLSAVELHYRQVEIKK